MVLAMVRDLDYSSIVPSPSFVAFNINFDFLGNDRLAVSVINKTEYES